jgi:hypothetical protein
VIIIATKNAVLQRVVIRKKKTTSPADWLSCGNPASSSCQATHAHCPQEQFYENGCMVRDREDSDWMLRGRGDLVAGLMHHRSFPSLCLSEENPNQDTRPKKPKDDVLYFLYVAHLDYKTLNAAVQNGLERQTVKSG